MQDVRAPAKHNDNHLAGPQCSTRANYKIKTPWGSYIAFHVFFKLSDFEDENTVSSIGLVQFQVLQILKLKVLWKL